MVDRALIRDEIREWKTQDIELAEEIRDLQRNLRSCKNQRTNAEFQLVEKLVKDGMYWLVKIDKTAVGKYMMEQEDLSF